MRAYSPRRSDLDRLGLAGVSALALAVATPLHAQEASTVAQPPQDPAAEPDVASTIDDVVVTARKRTENLRDAPVAITVISGEQLQTKNITQMIDLAAVTPNFQFNYGAVQPFTFIRGFGSGAKAAFEQSVGKFIDNVSYGRDQDGRIPLFDIERLELLKGPQVLTFGNSATVGAMNITTRRPGDFFEADGSVGYEFNNRELQAQGGVTLPLNDWASVRLAGLYQELDEGRLDNPTKGESEPTTRNWALRPSLRLRPVEGLDIRLKAEFDRLRDDGSAVVPVGQPLARSPGPWPVVGNTEHRYANYNVAPYFSDEFGELRADLYQADIDYDLLGGTLTSTTAWRDTDAAIQFGADGVDHGQTYFNALWQHYQQFSQEVRFNGTYGALDITAGGYYQRDTLLSDLVVEFTLGGFGRTGIAATPIGRVSSYEQKSRAFSGFFDAAYRITDRLSVSGGVRYVDINKRAGQSLYATPIIPNLDFNTSREDLAAYRTTALDTAFGAIFGSTVHDFAFGTLELDEDHWQPQAILQYELADRNNIYLKYVQGAKAGGFDDLFTGGNPDQSRYGTEEAESWELGLKGQVLDGALDYSIAAFRTTFTDMQQSVLQNISYVVSNIGEARSQGVELDLTYRPTDSVRVSFAGSYLDAEFVDFPGAACHSGQNAGIDPGCVGGAQDLSGTPTQYASKWTGSLGVDYRRPIGDGAYTMAVGASVFARTKYNAGAYNDPRMEQSGFAQVDAHLDIGPSDGAWRLSLFGRNLTDEQVLEYGTLQPASSTAVVGAYSRGRQIGLKFSIRTL